MDQGTSPVMVSVTQPASTIMLHFSVPFARSLRDALDACIARSDAEEDRYSETKDEPIIVGP
jgi:hypothetical protein